MDELGQTCTALNGMACNQSLSDGPLQQTVISGYSVPLTGKKPKCYSIIAIIGAIIT